MLIHKREAERWMGMAGAFWNPSCMLPPIRPGLLIFPRSFHQLVIENSNIPISLWGPFSFNHCTTQGDQPKKENCISEYLGRFIFISEGKLSYQWTNGRLDNIKIKKGGKSWWGCQKSGASRESKHWNIKVNKSTVASLVWRRRCSQGWDRSRSTKAQSLA